VSELSPTAVSVPVAQSPTRYVPRDLLLPCGLAWGAGLIHLQAAIDHVDEYWPYAACFVALAVVQLAWGVALYRRPESNRLLVSGVALSLAVIAVWILSRTAGLPLGPDSRTPETVGLLDSIATGDELVLCALVAVMHLSVGLGRSPRRCATGGLATLSRVVALLAIFFTSLVLGGGFHAH
jgi:hypothetical protein